MILKNAKWIIILKFKNLYGLKIIKFCKNIYQIIFSYINNCPERCLKISSFSKLDRDLSNEMLFMEILRAVQKKNNRQSLKKIKNIEKEFN